MMRVYRVETLSGVGVHHSGHAPWSPGVDDIGSPMCRRPMPSSYHLSNVCDCPRGYDDGRREPQRGKPEHTVFGFPSMEALCRYFNEADRATMRKERFVFLGVYECPDDTVRGDEVQVTFWRCSAALLDLQEIPT